jgi:hypothetical protein
MYLWSVLVDKTFIVYNPRVIVTCLSRYNIHHLQEEFEDTKGVMRIRISKKNRQRNGQKEKHDNTLHYNHTNQIHQDFNTITY